mmetsp:Transcript_38939/g.54085  ORF Transcript_38939/g.54085 Transcript_38939/m.54085 type:complete len:97 (+) Transcript_38939:847-1137(+)
MTSVAFLKACGTLILVCYIAALVQLYEEPEKPGNAIDYVRTAFGSPTPAEFDSLVEEKKELLATIEDMKKEIEELSNKVHELENPPEEGEGDAPLE